LTDSPTISPIVASAVADHALRSDRPDRLWRRLLGNGRFLGGALVLVAILGSCLVTLPITTKPYIGTDEDGYPISNPNYYNAQDLSHGWVAPKPGPPVGWFGTDEIGRSMLMQCLFGGTISLAVGTAAAAISVILGVSVGLVAGYRGGWVDSLLMRFVDVMYGLPYVLLIILFKVALEDPLERWFGTGLWVNQLLRLAVVISAAFIVAWRLWRSRPSGSDFSVAFVTVIAGALLLWLLSRTTLGRPLDEPGRAGNLVVLFLAIGLVSWLTMARVVRGQVLSLRTQPFVDAARAAGLPEWRIFLHHLLPNLAGPIIVYATLTIPQAILQESFLSFLGIGIQAPMSTWGSLAAAGLTPGLQPHNAKWWTLLFPCTLLCLTLLSLNFLGDGLRDLADPKREVAKI
jgi:oligopeptide transport system permease protein